MRVDVPLGECYFSKNSRKPLQLSYDGLSIIRFDEINFGHHKPYSIA